MCWQAHTALADEDPTTWLDNGRRLEEMLTQQNAVKVEYGPSPGLPLSLSPLSLSLSLTHTHTHTLASSASPSFLSLLNALSCVS
jgi:hypothetical protein